MIDILDYVLDYDDNFWIINEVGKKIKGYMVYSVCENGTRYNNITKKYYEKHTSKELVEIPKFKQVFKPQEFYKDNKNNLKGVWLDFVHVLNDIGINDEDIGIFGSYLIGFDIIKDVDFVIYGIDNLYKYYEKNEYIKEKIHASFITDEHINYQYNKHKNNYSPKTDLLKIIGRNWSGVQIKKGVLSTPRFIEKSLQNIYPNVSDKKVIRCEVIDGITSALLPRRAKVKYQEEEYTILSSLWKYQSFLKTGDIIECMGSVDENRKEIYLFDTNCYVKFLNEAT